MIYGTECLGDEKKTEDSRIEYDKMDVFIREFGNQ